ncbi:MAG: hypothetical protein LBS74_01235 [Oscillospiraceae bacterium]|jgi:hypothetical protein|nr:hypothetical protein [Oscillospiraceae bacterium]
MNVDYTSAELYAMQKEAERRVYEMQRRANRTLVYDIEPEEEKVQAKVKPKPFEEEGVQVRVSRLPAEYEQEAAHEHHGHEHHEHEHNEHHKHDGAGKNPGLNGLMEMIDKNPDRALILILLFILIKEQADQELIFMLIYLLL